MEKNTNLSTANKQKTVKQIKSKTSDNQQQRQQQQQQQQQQQSTVDNH